MTAMLNTRVCYDEVSVDHRPALQARESDVLSAFLYRSVRWIELTDSQGRPHFRLTEYSNRNAGLCQIVLLDLDYPDLKERMMNGEFRVKEV